MDNNEFSIDKLLESCDFERYESCTTREVMNELFDIIKRKIDDEKTADYVISTATGYGCMVFNDAFKQGFCFAMKAFKFLMKC